MNTRECSVCGVKESDRKPSGADSRFGWRVEFYADIVYHVCPDCFAEQRERQHAAFVPAEAPAPLSLVKESE